MTSVPKPLKFLKQHYDALKAQLEALPAGAANREPLADVVSEAAQQGSWHSARAQAMAPFCAACASVFGCNLALM